MYKQKTMTIRKLCCIMAYTRSKEIAMNPAARKQEIMKILQQNQTVQVIDLARSLDVSKVTIRTDLDELENRGVLVRTYGGARSEERRGGKE